MQRPPAYYKWSQFDDRCSCGKQIAIHQRKFEKITKKHMDEGIPLNLARIKAIKSLGIKKSCCLRDVTNFSKNFIFDTHMDAYTSISNNGYKDSGDNLKDQYNPQYCSFEFLPMTNETLGFDMNAYLNKLNRISTPIYDKIVPTTTPRQNYVSRFPKYIKTKTMNMPSVKCVEVPLEISELMLIKA